MVEEYKRKCNKCGKVWHSLVSRERGLKAGAQTDACVGALNATAGNSVMTAHNQRSTDTKRGTLEQLKCCPNCGSRDYEEEIVGKEE